MNKNLLMLEYDKVLKLLSDQTSNEDTKQKILNIRPCFGNLKECERLLKETDDAYVLSCKYGSPSLGGIENTTGIVRKATFGAVLSAKELLLILSVLKVVGGVKSYRKQFLGTHSTLDSYFDSITPNSYLKDKIENTILSEDELSDNASKELYDIRRKIRHVSQRSREKLESIIRGTKYQKCLQEPIVTIRDSRFVLPVKSEYRTEVQGIVHDISSSGATVFIEPMFAIEDNNTLGSLRLKEKYEIERILKDISLEVAKFSDDIIRSYNALIDLDVIFSKVNLGYKLRCSVPNFNVEGRVNLKRARHPLIPQSEVVPVDVDLGTNFDSLIITGTNTGGKTVVLKTIGLLCIMAMSGLMIPVDSGSEVSVYDSVLVDIGDEQSIEQSLSTFSSHIKNVVNILETTTNKSLVLLDEIGAGTDPIQGATLARAIIESIRSKGSKLVVTTHYKELKEYAIVSPRVENACCEFDVSNLKPTYKLIMGIPGNSYAFLIAKKLGISPEIIGRAEKFIDSHDISIEEILKELESTRVSLKKELDVTQKERQKYSKLSRDLEERISKFERQKNNEVEKYKYEAKRLLDKVRSETESLMTDIKTIRKGSLDVSPEKRRSIYSKIKGLEEVVDPVDDVCVESQNNSLRVGDNVLVLGINKEGVVLSFESENTLLVQVGNMKLNLSREKLKLLKGSKSDKKVKGRVVSQVRSIKNVSACGEIDLRGKNVLEAIHELDMFIDSSVLARMSKITIIHGKGTGVLRREISKYLKSHKNVSGFRLGTFGEGESGVTIVELKV